MAVRRGTLPVCVPPVSATSGPSTAPNARGAGGSPDRHMVLHWPPQQNEASRARRGPYLRAPAGSKGGLPPAPCPMESHWSREDTSRVLSVSPREQWFSSLLPAGTRGPRAGTRPPRRAPLRSASGDAGKGMVLAGETLPYEVRLPGLLARLLGRAAPLHLAPGEAVYRTSLLLSRASRAPSGRWRLALLGRRLLSDCKSVDSPFPLGLLVPGPGCRMEVLGPWPGTWLFRPAHARAA